MVGHVDEVSSSAAEVNFEITFPHQTVNVQTLEADLLSLHAAIGVVGEQSGLGTSLLPLGWVHDHHALPDEPTIDHDCWSQLSFQRDNPWFLMMITGERAKRTRRPKGASPAFDNANLFSVYSLTKKVMETTQGTYVHGVHSNMKEAFRQQTVHGGNHAPLGRLAFKFDLGFRLN